MRSWLALICLAAALAAGCAGDLPKKKDGAVTTPGYEASTPVPDLPVTTKKDLYWPPPADGYVGAPFGCVADRDCFGQRCCPTPWGVKLCAPVCDLR